MTATEFDRDAMAKNHARSHQQVTPSITAIYYLPHGAPPREVRLIEVSPNIPDLTTNPVEPVGFGIDGGTEDFHMLEILDVTPAMWDKIQDGRLELPAGWSLKGVQNLIRPRVAS